ncbi:MAG: spore germination protein GerW family protein [Clostridia bacterium]
MKEFENYENPIEEIIETSIDKIKTLSDTETVFGEPIKSPNGATIIPISKVTVGFIVGGGQYVMSKDKRATLPYPMAASTGGGILLTPIGFLIEEKDLAIKFVPCSNLTANDAVVSSIISIVSAIVKNSSKENNKEKDKDKEKE